MAKQRLNRKLAAILVADVVGYSRLMATDEGRTLAALKRHRETIFDPAVAAHNGRLVKLIGDGAIAEFASIVDAVNCALSLQTAGASLLDQSASEPRIVLRIGINLGDVIIEGDDIYGDGVNIAARLEPLAEPGGICISSIVNESVGNRIDIRFQDAGETNVKNIDRPIRIWKWQPGARPSVSARLDAVAKANGSIASIAILPFTNMSGDAEQEYFSDGISEDIITDLSKIAGLDVIARNSSFAYKGRSVDVRTIGRELGVRSVLEGSIRRAGNRVRITAQLIDAATGKHLWAERYDRELTDIFAVQDDVTRRIVDALKVTLSPAEKARLTEAGTSNMEAYDCVLRAREFLFGRTINRETFECSLRDFRRALELDPHYAQALAGLGLAYLLDYQNHWSDGPAKSLQLAKHYSERAVEENGEDSSARRTAALIAIFEKDLARAKSEIDLALSLSPNSALACNTLGSIQILSGEPLAAIPTIERAIRLDPNTPLYLHFLGMAYLLARKHEAAVTVLKQRVLLTPRTDFSRALLASALGHVGEFEEARRLWRELMEINPKYSLDEHLRRLPYREADIQYIAEGVAKAGLPV